MSDLHTTIEAVTRGDLQAFQRLQALGPRVRLGQVGHEPLLLEVAAVRHVLIELQAGRADPNLVAEWAGLMRWGVQGRWTNVNEMDRAKSNMHGLLDAVDIEFEADHEEGIVEALARLDEIDDDGPPSPTEISQLISGL